MELYYLTGLFLIIILLYLLAKNMILSNNFFKDHDYFLVVYLIWRLFYTIPIDSSVSLIFGIILYIAEFIGLFVYGFYLPIFE